MIAACLKWVDLRPEVDRLRGHVRSDPRTAGISPADAAALEWALRCGERWGQPVMAVSSGPAAADRVLRDALAVGAAHAVRVDMRADLPSGAVAAELGRVLRPAGVGIVWCGDHSLDRGSGSLPGFLAAELGLPQALGLVDVALGDECGHVVVCRRLDRGRRERVGLDGAGVLSVEGSTARLRRAALGALMAARDAAVDVAVPVLAHPADGPGTPVLHAFRPRARELPAPAGATPLDRIRALTETGTPVRHGELLVLDPPAAAQRILETLAAWSQLPR